MRITALVDQSVYRKSVIDHAAWVAETVHGTVEVLFVVARNELLANRMPVHPTGAIILSDVMTVDMELTRIREQGEGLLVEARAALLSTEVGGVRTRIEEGNVDQVAVAAGAEADLLVIGKRGEHADLARLPLGANVESIVRGCSIPVLVVSRAFRPIRRALVAFDDDDACGAAIDVLSTSRIVPPIPILLLHVGQETEGMKSAIAAAAGKLEKAGYEVSIEFAFGIAERVIAERAVTDATDLVIMGTYGRSRLKSLFFGSLTNEVIRATQTPVLLVNKRAS